MICPRCDGQGEIVRARIKATGEIVSVCEECDALWPEGVKINPTSFTDLSQYVAPFGLEGTWNEIQILPSIEAK